MNTPPLVYANKNRNRQMAVLSSPLLRQYFPLSKDVEVGGHVYQVIPHTQYEYSALKALGYPVPNPMRAYYDWPGPESQPPFEVQRTTCDLVTTHKRAYVLNGMGTGKTRSVLWAWDWLRNEGHAGKLLIVAPLSTLNFVWMKEIFQTIRHRKAVVLHGTKKQRVAALSDTTMEIYIINHHGVAVIFDELMQRPDIDTVVLDELAAYRTPGRTRSRLMRKLVKDRKFVWGMTGSPMPNAPTDVWSQCAIVTPHTVPKFFTHARDELMLNKGHHKHVPKPGGVETAFKWMQPSVRFALDDVVELPPVIERYMDVDMTAEQNRVYSGIVRHCTALAADKQITAQNAAVAMGKLLQIAGGWVYAGDHSVASLDAVPRIKMLVDTILECERKVIVFAPFKHALTGISEALTKEKIEHFRIDGDTKPLERERIFTHFQSTTSRPQMWERTQVLIAHPATMAHGVTLTAADTIIWFLPVTSLETYEQANARIRRVGQKHKQQIIHIVGSPVERRVYGLLRTKQKVQDKFLSMFEDASLLGEPND